MAWRYWHHEADTVEGFLALQMPRLPIPTRIKRRLCKSAESTRSYTVIHLYSLVAINHGLYERDG
jgi:hypothetical protein